MSASLPLRALHTSILGGMQVLLVLLIGCASSSGPSAQPVIEPETSGSAQRAPAMANSRFGIDSIESASGGIEAFRGMATVVPVTVTGTPPASGVVDARLPLAGERGNGSSNGGASVPARLEWLGVEPMRTADWLPMVRWQTLSVGSRGTVSAAGRWILVLELPADSEAGEVMLQGRTFPIRWLPHPDQFLEMGHHGPALLEVWTSPLPPAALASAQLRSTLERLKADPLEAWRAELALGELGRHTSEEPSTLGSLKAQQRARWKTALATLGSLDAGLASRMRTALTRVVQVGPGWWVPAWETNPATQEQIADSLLEVPVNPGRVRRLVELWLAEQPDAMARVMDSAGGGIAQGEVVRSGPMLEVVNLRPAASLAWIETADGPVVAEAPGQGVARITLAATTDTGAPMQVHCGQWTMDLSIRPQRGVARPPGLLMDAFAPVLDAPSWLAMGGTPEVRERIEQRIDPSSSVFLHRRPGRQAGEPERWTLLIECRSIDHAPASGDELRLWFGPMHQSEMILSVSPVAGVRTIDGPVRVSGTVQRVGSTGGQSGWRAEIPLPDEVIPMQGPLLLGAARMLDGAVISSWPTAVTPWQREPARSQIDLSQWDSVGR